MTRKPLTARQRRRNAQRARAARGPLTDEARERLRKAITDRRPWERSTGPRTADGKARVRENAVKHGRRVRGVLPPEVLAAFVAVALAEQGRGPVPDEEATFLAGLWTMDAGERAGLWGLWSRGAELMARHQRLMRRQAGPMP